MQNPKRLHHVPPPKMCQYSGTGLYAKNRCESHLPSAYVFFFMGPEALVVFPLHSNTRVRPILLYKSCQLRRIYLQPHKVSVYQLCYDRHPAVSSESFNIGPKQMVQSTPLANLPTFMEQRPTLPVSQ